MWLVLRHIYKEKYFTVPLIANFLSHNNRNRFDFYISFFNFFMLKAVL